MRRFKNLVIGGIENKIFNLILFTVILLTAAYMAVSVYHSNMLSKLAADSGQQQQQSIVEISSSVMEVSLSLERTNRTEAKFADEMFEAARSRVAFLGDYAAKLFAHPEEYAPRPWAAPDPADDGVWTAKVIFADGVDADDPAIADRVGLVANLSEAMISLCQTFGAEDIYIGLPEGIMLSVSDSSSGWFVNGKPRSYDPRQRAWYIQAAEAGKLIFSDCEVDADTGEYCVECAMPVYGPDGSLRCRRRRSCSPWPRTTATATSASRRMSC